MRLSNPFTRIARASTLTRRNFAFGLMLAVIILGSSRSHADSTEVPPDLITTSSQSIGVGQTWHSVARGYCNTYINNFERPIQVAVTVGVTSKGGQIHFYVDSVTVGSLYNNSSTDFNSSFEYVIPAGSSYRVCGSGSRTAINRWSELS